MWADATELYQAVNVPITLRLGIWGAFPSHVTFDISRGSHMLQNKINT